MNNNSPKYVVDLTKFKRNCEDVMSSFENEWGNNILYGYSVKTNRDRELIKFAYSKLGWYIEMVSPDEYNYCLDLGISRNRMIFNGPCKEEIVSSNDMIAQYINLDNLDEVVAFCSSGNSTDNVGLRVNFDLESVCPTETTAGEDVSRFGIDTESEDFSKAINMLLESGNKNIGIHLHTSTKTRSINVFKALAKKAVELKRRYNIDFSFVDVGGGFFGGQIVDGKPTMKGYAKAICDELKNGFEPSKTTLILEPGASVLATSVSYQTTVINVRDIRGVRVITLDGTSLHINPFMAKRGQPFTVLTGMDNRKVIHKQIVCGATCMENDRVAVLENEVALYKGDILSFYNVGAYTMAFNSYFILNPPQIEYVGG